MAFIIKVVADHSIHGKDSFIQFISEKRFDAIKKNLIDDDYLNIRKILVD